MGPGSHLTLGIVCGGSGVPGVGGGCGRGQGPVSRLSRCHETGHHCHDTSPVTRHTHTGNTDPDWAAVKTNNKLGANRGETYLGEEIIIV